jgi:hypothetical protein
MLLGRVSLMYGFLLTYLLQLRGVLLASTFSRRWIGPVTIFNYNQSALKIGDSVAPTKLCKHINIRYHNVREKIVEGLVKLLYMCTRDMPADQLTKNLGFTQLQGHRSFINW